MTLPAETRPSQGKTRSVQSRILSGSVVLLSGSGLNNLINLAYNIAIARALGPTGFGHVTAVYTGLTVLSAATLSFQLIAAKLVAQQTSDEGRAGVYRAMLRSSCIAGAALAAILLLFAGPLTHSLHLPTPILIVLLAVGTVFYVPLGSRRGYLQGICNFQAFARNLILEGLVRFLGSLLMVALGFGVVAVMAANVAAVAIAFLAIPPRLPAPQRQPVPLLGARRELFHAVVFFSGQVLINNSDILLVKHFFEPKVAGVYAAIAMVGRVIFALSSAVGNSMFPVIAGTRQEDRRNLAPVGVSLLLVLVIGTVVAVGLRLSPASLWTRFFGPAFVMPAPFSLPYLLSLYALTTVLYCLSTLVITYEMSYKIAKASRLQLLASGLLVLGICFFHESLREVILVQFFLMLGLLPSVGLPFLVSALRRRRPATGKRLHLLRRVSEDEVITEFLKSDLNDAAYRKFERQLRPIVFAPDLHDQNEAAQRRALLFLRHRALWEELPNDTVWYEATVEPATLPLIHVFPRAQWRRIARRQFGILTVAEQLRDRPRPEQQALSLKINTIRQGLRDPDYQPGSVVLIGLDEEKPLTIIDGNHRFVAAVLEGRLDRLRFLCGMSPRMTRCCWYRTNPFTLTRYSRNLLWQRLTRPETELERLVESLR